MQISQFDNQSFPSACIKNNVGKNLIEVHLIGELGRGNTLMQQASTLQKHHPRFVHALDEPSTCIGEFAQGDSDHSSVYTFLVESQGHPFHRHASARMFTAVSGSEGTQLRFSTLNLEMQGANLDAFLQHAHCMQIPADCLFTVRFAAGVWHQFMPGRENSNAPALFAVSYHPDDLSGIDDFAMQEKIKGGFASIPMLTEVLPASMADGLAKLDFIGMCAKVIKLEFPRKEIVPIQANPSTKAFSRDSSLFSRTRQISAPPHSLIWEQLTEQVPYHLDHFELFISYEELGVMEPVGANKPHGATSYMNDLLTAFIEASPASVTCLMQLRNLLVKPFGLRTSRVGCPVSSLLADRAQEYFLNRYPVWGQKINLNNTEVQIVLGADDKHLQFRSVVMVEVKAEGIVISLSNRVAYRNLFGQIYMRCIRSIHQKFIVPKMLATAASKLVAQTHKLQVRECWCRRLMLAK